MSRYSSDPSKRDVIGQGVGNKESERDGHDKEPLQGSCLEPKVHVVECDQQHLGNCEGKEQDDFRRLSDGEGNHSQFHDGEQGKPDRVPHVGAVVGCGVEGGTLR